MKIKTFWGCCWLKVVAFCYYYLANLRMFACQKFFLRATRPLLSALHLQTTRGQGSVVLIKKTSLYCHETEMSIAEKPTIILIHKLTM